MNWFKRVQKGLRTSQKREMPDNLWIKCKGCGEILFRKELEKALHVCPKCGHHFRMGSNLYIPMLADENSYREISPGLMSVDPLGFKTSKKYSDQLKEAKKRTGLKDACRIGEATIDGYPVVLGAMDFGFIGGSMGSVVGEKVSRGIETARENNCPLIIVSSSGGARMQEGILSLMQMAKTSAKLSLISEEGPLFISILTDPTTGGVTASFGMLGDIIIAEPGALVGFAGPRVIKQTIGQDLPEGFQRAEFLIEKGFVDMIVERNKMKSRISDIIRFFNHD